MKKIVMMICFLLATDGLLHGQNSPPPAPIVSASVNGALTSVSYTTWPLVIEAELHNPQALQPTATPIVIDSLSGSWTNWATVVVRDSSGNLQNWPVHTAAVPSGSLTLGYNTEGVLAWWVNPQDVAAIPQGNYRVFVVLNTTGDAGGGWKGMASSAPVHLSIATPPSPLPAQTSEKQSELLAGYHRLQGNKTQALMDIANLLQKQPNSVRGLWFQADLLADSGQPQQALNSYNGAVKAFYSPGVIHQEPPTELLHARAAVQNQLLSQTGAVGRPQISALITGHGAQALGVIYLDLQFTNTGNGDASSVSVNQVLFRILSGSGTVSYNNTLSPAMPVVIQQLQRNTSKAVRLFLNVPTTVLEFSISENGTVADMFETPYNFAAAQALVP